MGKFYLLSMNYSQHKTVLHLYDILFVSFVTLQILGEKSGVKLSVAIEAVEEVFYKYTQRLTFNCGMNGLKKKKFVL